MYAFRLRLSRAGTAQRVHNFSFVELLLVRQANACKPFHCSDPVNLRTIANTLIGDGLVNDKSASV